ncbi:hypothetical protein F4V43_13525 [Paenibacillus spiritus]|uniref:Uncharacterized protein n=1 Tax=Paenibacillus spiritus TaxID=2496557 RepID=A0A5J5G4T7_9BACL|nr:hypothetical protein [Paenibacillus spiritus]KAA9002077.1 hypothetical protein F4V43_13525 [Paenibacillus spiritus]
MKKIKLYLEYQCYPMWIYDEVGELVDNNIAIELENDSFIAKALDEIQETYDSLFEDNEVNFEFKGFAQEQDREDFLRLVNEIVISIERKLSNKYKVENKINL